MNPHYCTPPIHTSLFPKKSGIYTIAVMDLLDSHFYKVIIQKILIQRSSWHLTDPNNNGKCHPHHKPCIASFPHSLQGEPLPVITCYIIHKSIITLLPTYNLVFGPILSGPASFCLHIPVLSQSPCRVGLHLNANSNSSLVRSTTRWRLILSYPKTFGGKPFFFYTPWN